MTGSTDEMFRAARAEAEAFRAAQAARRAIEGRRPFRYGGGACTLLLMRCGDQIELLPHATDSWAITLDEAHAVELRDALTELLALGGQP